LIESVSHKVGLIYICSFQNSLMPQISVKSNFISEEECLQYPYLYSNVDIDS